MGTTPWWRSGSTVLVSSYCYCTMGLIIASFCARSCHALISHMGCRNSSVRLYSGSVPQQRWKRRGGAATTPTRNESASPSLEWENFDFGDSPKWDKRFESNEQLEAGTSEELHQVAMRESKEDVKTANEINQRSTALDQLSPDWVASATSILSPYVQASRLERLNEVLSQRTQHCRFLFENPVNPSNVWACLRTIDSFGVQHVDLVIQSQKYKGKAALSQKRGMRTAMGSAQWLTLRNHLSTTEAIESLRQDGYRILASDLNPDSRDIRTVDWISDNRPVCIVMGNESEGISEEMREAADETFTLPMCGFAESFNLSVATAITLAHLSASSTEKDKGPLRPGDLDENSMNRLRLRGILNSISQKKLGKAMLRRKGLDVPPEMDLLLSQ